ncbi:MAG: DedA family protein [Magnetococcales bacterium]|nr:DedA family protein [Magnetococcales bacterium]
MLLGYWGLFGVAFAAATILPLSSEVVLGGMLLQGGYSPSGLWAAATLGNVGGAWVNWLLGRYLQLWSGRRGGPVSRQALARAERWFNRFGQWTLLLAWVPVVGDPLTLAAGVLRVPLWRFLGLVFIGKGGRYLLIVHLAVA